VDNPKSTKLHKCSDGDSKLRAAAARAKAPCRRAPGFAEFAGGVAAAVATTCSCCKCSRVAVESRVVFGLVDRPEFDLRHLRCPFLSADPTTLQNSASSKEHAGAPNGGGGISDEKGESAGQMLEIDAVIVTDRELMYELDTAALRDILRTRWAHGLDSLSFDRAVTVAWILEPPIITSTSYAHVRSKPRDFDLVFSHDEAFLSELPDGRGHYVPLATCLIPSHQRAIHAKSKLVSILASARAHAPGHMLRHAIISQLGGRAAGVGADVLDAFGQAFDGQVSFFVGRFFVCVGIRVGYAQRVFQGFPSKIWPRISEFITHTDYQGTSGLGARRRRCFSRAAARHVVTTKPRENFLFLFIFPTCGIYPTCDGSVATKYGEKTTNKGKQTNFNKIVCKFLLWPPQVDKYSKNSEEALRRHAPDTKVPYLRVI